MLDEVVISGFSGRFPKSDNVEELIENLYKGIDMVTSNEERYPASAYDLPTRKGVIKNIENFDANFFNMPPNQVHKTDPQLRLLLEVTYEAFIDAGINPVEMAGTKTGVYIGVCHSEADDYWLGEDTINDGYAFLNCTRSMLANKLSYIFNLNGPSFSLDTGCSSSLYALIYAMNDIKTGKCDAAIVGGTNILLNPAKTAQFNKIGVLSKDGKCKVYDKSADGYARSEAVAVLLLQKVKDAKRNYATLVHGKVNADGYKDEGITCPKNARLQQMFQEVYSEARINLNDVVYFEAHGTGTPIGDPIEVNAIASTFGKGREKPLLLGSVKSNLGHTEAACGICGIIKILIASEKGIMPGNLHYVEPDSNAQSLIDGTIQVVNKNTPFEGGIVSVCAYGIGGANAHVVIRSNAISKVKKQTPVPARGVPCIITVSGRTKEAVEIFLDKLNKNKNNLEFLSLVHDIHSRNIAGHNFRGYEVLGHLESRQLVDTINTNRPIWYIFSGIESQWTGMGKDLLSIEIFKETVGRCSGLLRSKGIDLMNLIQSAGDNVFDNIVNSLVCIVAIQLALVDVLTSLKIKPEGLIGHSIGELSCAYADGTITLEQAVLIAYFYGKSIIETHKTIGAMAIVGLSFEETQKVCPSEVTLVADNASDSTTVSGPIDCIRNFVAQMQNNNIFSEILHTSNVALHSKYTIDAAPAFRRMLTNVISNPAERSSKWVSTSVPQSEWKEPAAKLSSVDYYVNNSTSVVHLNQALKHIPENAIVIEIAPHSVLQTILRKSLTSKSTTFGLQDSRQVDNLVFFLTNIGNLYNAGAQPQISRLYAPIKYPVSPGTPMINSLVKWDHSVKWTVPDFTRNYVSGRRNLSITIDLNSDEYRHIAGHVVDEEILFPASGYIVIAWKMFAKQKNVDFSKLPVIVENFEILHAILLKNTSSLDFSVNILEESGIFEIFESGSLKAKGIIRVIEDVEVIESEMPIMVKHLSSNLDLFKYDIYKALKLRGYDHQKSFQSIILSNTEITSGLLKVPKDWITFVDSIMQFGLLAISTNDHLLPTGISSIMINPNEHKNFIRNTRSIDVNFDHRTMVLKAAGVEMRNITFLPATRKQAQTIPVYERHLFIPFDNGKQISDSLVYGKKHALVVLLDIIKQNLLSLEINLVEVTGEREPEDLLLPLVTEILEGGIPTKEVECHLIAESHKKFFDFIDQYKIKGISNHLPNSKYHIVLAASLISNSKMDILIDIVNYVEPGCFIILEEDKTVDLRLLNGTNVSLCGKQVVNAKYYILLRKKIIRSKPIIVQVTGHNFNWLNDVKKNLPQLSNDQTILLINQGEDCIGLAGLASCLRLEVGGSSSDLRYIFVEDKNAPSFSFEEEFYTSQLEKQLVANVYKGGCWGSYCHLPLDELNDYSRVLANDAYIDSTSRNGFKSLCWIESPLKLHSLSQNRANIVEVYYAAINFKDVMLASGKLKVEPHLMQLNTQDCVIGFEYSGINAKKHRVMGMLLNKGLATSVIPDKILQWEVPERWTLEQAATVPIAYATSYYALLVRGKLLSGQSVLIHCGCGSVGLASIYIALHCGCKVFTTVGSQEKRKFLNKTFPQLPDENIGYSRDTSFEQMIMKETSGQGVDLVLNSLADSKLQASLRCLASDGQFLELGKLNLFNNSSLGMSFFLKNTDFKGINVETVFFGDERKKQELFHLVSEGIKSGAVQPLPVTVFSDLMYEDAFKYLAAGKNIGKVLLKIREEKPSTILSSKTEIPSIPRIYFHLDKSYIIIGGLGGFGLELVDWMTSREAKHFVLSSRTGVSTGYQSLRLKKWNEMGVNVLISTSDASTKKGAKELIEQANAMSPVGGIFNVAVVLHDALVENLNEDHFKEVFRPKVDVTKNLDILSRKKCLELDHFVCFSSYINGRGNSGQSNYGMANSAMESIIQKRHDSGLPGQAIQWGLIDDVGRAISSSAKIEGIAYQSISSCLKTLDFFLQLPYPILASTVSAKQQNHSLEEGKLSTEVTVANIMGFKDTQSLNLDTPLSAYGIDSFTTMEIKRQLEKKYNLILSNDDVRKLTFSKLKEFSNKTSN